MGIMLEFSFLGSSRKIYMHYFLFIHGYLLLISIFLCPRCISFMSFWASGATSGRFYMYLSRFSLAVEVHFSSATWPFLRSIFISWLIETSSAWDVFVYLEKKKGNGRWGPDSRCSGYAMELTASNNWRRNPGRSRGWASKILDQIPEM